MTGMLSVMMSLELSINQSHENTTVRSAALVVGVAKSNLASVENFF